jgi:mycoredoxin
MFSTSWCGYCRRLKTQLDREGVPFTRWTSNANPESARFVEEVNRGEPDRPDRAVPDGSAATNPSVIEVKKRLSA